MTRGPLLSKPCAREGCAEMVTANRPSKLARHRYCSQACVCRAKLQAGWKPYGGHTFTPDQRLKGGKLAAVARHRKATQRAAQAVAVLVPLKVREQLDAVTTGYLMAAMARAYRLGHTNGRRTAYQRHLRKVAA